MRIYNYLYECIFISFYNTWKNDIPQWNAAILFPLMIVLNLVIVLTLSGVLKYPNETFDIGIAGLVFYGLLILLNYLLFIRNKKYKEIASEFNSKKAPQRRRQYLIGIAISILGYTLPIIIIVLLSR
jgi:hypothetical protein